MGNRESENLQRLVSAKTAVFWDMQDCGIPDGLKAVEISQNIRSALDKMNYRGPTVIYGYGDTNQFMNDLEPTTYVHKHTLEGASVLDLDIMNYRGTISIYADESHVDVELPAIVVNHTPEGDKDARIEMILVDMFTWALKNSSPANCMLILGDITSYQELTTAYYFMRSYNFLLAQPEKASASPQLPIYTKFLWERMSYGHIDSVKREKPRPRPILLSRDRTSRVGSGRSPTGFLLAGVGALVGLVFSWVKLRSH